MNDQNHIHFLIVGEGYLKDSFRAEVADLDNISFAPGVPKAAVQSVLQNVDLVYFAVHKSPMMLFGQSLNKVIDYMLSGKPVLASFTGYPSMINEAECGSYVPAEDVDALHAEIERYAAMPAEDRERLAHAVVTGCSRTGNMKPWRRTIWTFWASRPRCALTAVRCAGQSIFGSNRQAFALGHVTRWLWTYNNERPDMGIGGMTPLQKLKVALILVMSRSKNGDYPSVSVNGISTDCSLDRPAGHLWRYCCSKGYPSRV